MDHPLPPPADAQSDVTAFLHANPDIKQIDVLICDNCGVLRGKKIPVQRLEKLYTEGVAFPGSVFSANIAGETIDETGLGITEGDADRLCFPIPNTLDTVPWATRPTGQVMIEMRDLDGVTPFWASPRTVLQGVVDQYKRIGLTPVTAIELEFYLVDRTRGHDGLPQPPLSPLTGRRQSTTQVYGIDELYDFDGLLAEIYDACRAQEIPVDSVVSEFAPGQYEINLHHVADPVEACDDAVLLKRAVKSVAIKHGIEATFMAKPYPEQAGCGMHIHLSLVDGHGQNVFSDPSPEGSATLGHAIGGMAATMAEGIGLFAQNQNAYRRFQRNSFAPHAPTWAVNNRSSALRVPAGKPKDRRVEHRVAGADANPYLVMAAAIAGAHYGITEQIPPGPPVTGNAYDLEDLPQQFTSSWIKALDMLEDSTVLRRYLGDRFLDTYITLKRVERDQFFSQITPLEYELYLHKV